jgi:hypothetical protein
MKMDSEQQKQMNALYAAIKERLSHPDIDLATRRDIAENFHLAATEPEAVTYAEVDAGGVPALWCHRREQMRTEGYSHREHSSEMLFRAWRHRQLPRTRKYQADANGVRTIGH